MTIGTGSNSHESNVYCKCHGAQKVAEVGPEGVEIVSRHHGTYHVGSLSAREVLSLMAGTVEGSAIIQFVQKIMV